MRQRLEIQELSVVSTGGGTFEETWTTIATRWANVKVMSQQESFRYGKDQQVNRYKIIMRNENYTNKNRFLFNNLILTIESIADPANFDRLIEVIARGELS